MHFIQVPKIHAHSVIQFLHQIHAIDPNFRISSYESGVLIPLLSYPLDQTIIMSLESLDVKYFDSELTPEIQQYIIKRSLHSNDLKTELISLIPSEYYDLIPKSYDIIGHIAIVDLNREEQKPLLSYKHQIAEKLLNLNKNIISVYGKQGDISGDFRVRDLELLAGEDNTITDYVENGFHFWVDVANTFFTPRLSFERKRISEIESSFISNGVTWDMFCGVGPYTIQLAKKYPETSYLGTDINPHAIKLAQKNAQRSKVSEKIEFINLDLNKITQSLISKYQNQISRLVMNLPEKNLEFIPILPRFLHPLGTLLHVYQFNPKESPIEDAIKKLEIALESCQLIMVELISSRIVKPFSPTLDTTVLDVIIKRV